MRKWPQPTDLLPFIISSYSIPFLSLTIFRLNSFVSIFICYFISLLTLLEAKFHLWIIREKKSLLDHNLSFFYPRCFSTSFSVLIMELEMRWKKAFRRSLRDNHWAINSATTRKKIAYYVQERFRGFVLLLEVFVIAS